MSLCFFIKTPSVISDQSNDTLIKNKKEIIDLIKKSVADTEWMRASTRKELDTILGRYYTALLISKLNNSTWDFINLPTDWDYFIKAENIKIASISENKAIVCFEIIEIDTLTCNKFSNKAKCHLIKTENGWRINQLIIIDS